MNEFSTRSPEQTESSAATWAASLNPGSVILLKGDLGAGKTCFARGFLRGLGGSPESVSSPSYTLLQQYPSPRGILYHWDLYRLEPDTDWSILDLEDHLWDPEAFTLIEWPERHPHLAGKSTFSVQIKSLSETHRTITISPASTTI